MIKVKISELINSTDTLQKLAKTELKAKLAWSISRLLRAAEKEIQDFNDARMTLITKYGEKDENGELVTDERGNCKINPDSVEIFSNEINELINTEVEINANRIKIDDLDGLDFTPNDMAILEPYIEIEE